MLTDLHIENIAIIDSLDVELTSGFIVLTGETGAGKSIIIDAVNMLIGERISREMVRTGEKKALVSAIFSDVDEDILKIISQNGIETEDNQLILSREFSAEGKGVARINGRPVNVAVLREVGSRLINIHGQHDNTALLNPDSHLAFLDKYAKNEDLLSEYRESYAKAVSLKRQIESFNTDKDEKEKKVELLKFQIEEIESSNLKEDEEALLEKRKEILVNSEKIMESLNVIRAVLTEDEVNVHDMLTSCLRETKNICKYDSSQSSLNEKLTDISASLDDISEFFSSYSESLDFDPNELDSIEERLDTIRRLKRKYGNSVSDIYEYLEKAQKELEMMDISDVKLKTLTEDFVKAKADMKCKAENLSSSRREAAARLEISMIETLSFLEMPKVRFSVNIKNKKFDKTGADEVEFLLSANQGEELRPLNKIASGGELSRIMLSIKNVLADNSVQTMIFDEIDTGISGRAAQKVAIKLKEMSSCGQVIVITHLAQIASYADTHFKITKETVGERTHTVLTELGPEDRRYELARIMGGIDITDSLLATADEMIKNSKL